VKKREEWEGVEREGEMKRGETGGIEEPGNDPPQHLPEEDTFLKKGMELEEEEEES